MAKTYTLGDDVVSQAVSGSVSHLLYDGHGSTRQLADTTGTVSASFAYDAYGVSLTPELDKKREFNSVTECPTDLLYSGEQHDSTLGLGYNRARYYDYCSAQWNRLDDYEGDLREPQSLHKYAYVHGDPVNGIDPSGNGRLASIVIALVVVVIMLALVFVAIPGFYSRFGTNWGVKKDPPRKWKIALVRGDFSAVDCVGAWNSGVSIARLAVELQSGGHKVEIFQSPTEDEFVNILNNYDLVGVFAHGPPDGYDANNKPFAGFKLGGTSQHQHDIVTMYPDRGQDPISPRAGWVTANELNGKINNQNLEIAAASCSSAKTNSMHKATRAKAYVGMDKPSNAKLARYVLTYIVDRANGTNIDEAKENVKKHNSHIAIDPSNGQFNN